MSPYSWTYPGGVTRHIDALARELAAAGHEPTILAPFDPDDERAARMHRGARPHESLPSLPFVPLGRTVGLRANGAVSNLALTPHAVFTLRRALRGQSYDVVHIHEPVAPVIGWDALCSLGEMPLVGTFHTYSENPVTNGIAAVQLGGRRRMNRLRVRIAVSDAAAWTARRFYGGRYRIVPNGVHVPAQESESVRAASDPLRVLFVGQAVERKGLPVLLHAFEALREQIPAELVIVGAGPAEVAHMMLDDRGVSALGKVSEQRKLAELAGADIVCAPSLHGESFGMVLTEACAAGAPVVASDIPGYRDVVRDGREGLLVPPGDAVALAEALRALALDPALRGRLARGARERAERFAWPNVAAEVADCYEQALRTGVPATRKGRLAVRAGLVPADLLPRIPAEHLPSLWGEIPRSARAGSGSPPSRMGARVRRGAILASAALGIALALLAVVHVGLDRVAASLVASKPGLIAAGFGSMCAAMLARAIAWHAILAAAPTWRRAKKRDAMQGTFIGVLMSSTLPARLGEPSRALIVARRIGRARETLPVVLGTMVSQTLLNLLALAIIGTLIFSSVDPLDGQHRALFAAAMIPPLALVLALLAPALSSTGARRRALASGLRRSAARLRDGLRLFAKPRQALRATVLQLGAWGLQLLSCWLLLRALGMDGRAGVAGAAAILFTVNATALLPATPGNVGVFQVACVAVLVGAYHVSTPEALAYGIVLQVVETATALLMGTSALVNEGLTWRDVRLRTIHATPVKLGPLPGAAARAAARAER